MTPDRASDLATLSDLLTACSRIVQFTRGVNRSAFDHNAQLLSACCYQIAVIGEAAKRLSPATRGRYSDVPWKDIAGMRDRLIHGYDSVDVDQLWRTCTSDIPVLIERIRRIQAEFAGE